MRYPIVAILIVAAFSVGLSQIPTDEYIEIQTASGAVRVKNFYKTAQFVGENLVAITENNQYLLDYGPHKSDFLIQVSGYEPEEVRKNKAAAEIELLNKLGVDETTACKLDVSVVVLAAKVDHRFQLGNYGLSFCPGNKPLPGAPTSSRVTRKATRTQPTTTQTPSGLNTSQECVGLLPHNLVIELGRIYAGSSVVTLKQLDREARGLLTKQVGRRCPGIVHLDFFGDHRDTYGVLLATNSSAPDSSNVRLILASRVRPSAAWQVQTLEESVGELGWMWIARDKPGLHRDVYGKKIIRAKGETLFFAAGETVAILYGWTGKSIDKVWLAD